jgi:hypothetical protein
MNTVPTPPPEPVRHGWAELLTLVGAIRRIAHDITLEAGDALRRFRDLYASTTREARRELTRRNDGPHARAARPVRSRTGNVSNDVTQMTARHLRLPLAPWRAVPAPAAGVLVFDIASDAEPAWIELHASPSSGGVTVLLG